MREVVGEGANGEGGGQEEGGGTENVGIIRKGGSRELTKISVRLSSGISTSVAPWCFGITSYDGVSPMISSSSPRPNCWTI